MRAKFIVPFQSNYQAKDDEEVKELILKRKKKLLTLLSKSTLPRKNIDHEHCKVEYDGKKSQLDLDAICDLYSKRGGLSFNSRTELVDAYMEERHHVAHTLNKFRRESKDLKAAQNHAASLRDRSRNDTACVLMIKILKCTGLEDVNAYGKYRVHMDHGPQTIETRALRAIGGEIKYDELFCFNTDGVNTAAHEELVISMKSETGDVTYNTAHVHFAELKDQEQKAMTLSTQGPVAAAIDILVQWIHNKTLLYGRHASAYRERQAQLVTLIRDYQMKLAAFDKPFKPTKQGISGLFKDLYKGHFAAEGVDNVLENMGLTNTQKASQVFVSLYLGLVCFTSYARAMFLDQGVALFAFFYNLDARRWTVKKYNNCVYSLSVAMILDIWWIYYYLLQWGAQNSELAFVQLTRIFTIVNFVWRILLIVFFWKCGRDLNERIQRNDSSYSQMKYV